MRSVVALQYNMYIRYRIMLILILLYIIIYRSLLYLDIVLDFEWYRRKGGFIKMYVFILPLENTYWSGKSNNTR